MVSAKDIKTMSQELNLLYAEDEAMLRDSMLPTLQKLFQNVYIAKDGQEAYELYQKNEIDIVLTDINMPNMDGVELITKINELPSEPIIIVLSAHDESTLLKTLINLEVNTFLNKPVEKDSLMLTLYRNCSIISNKKLLAHYSQQLEIENRAMRRKNVILEQKLKQLATQTNKNEARNEPKQATETSKEESYYNDLMQDDIDELRDLSEELDTYIMMMFQNESLNTVYINKLIDIYQKYTSVLNSYSEFYEISSILQHFTQTIINLEEKFLRDINQTGIYFESLQLTLETFRQNVWEKEAKDPKFYNASLKNDIQLVIDFLEEKEAQENEIEFF